MGADPSIEKMTHAAKKMLAWDRTFIPLIFAIYSPGDKLLSVVLRVLEYNRLNPQRSFEGNGFRYLSKLSVKQRDFVMEKATAVYERMDHV
jgi:hypothetical protein